MSFMPLSYGNTENSIPNAGLLFKAKIPKDNSITDNVQPASWLLCPIDRTKISIPMNKDMNPKTAVTIDINIAFSLNILRKYQR